MIALIRLEVNTLSIPYDAAALGHQPYAAPRSSLHIHSTDRCLDAYSDPKNQVLR